MDRHFLELIPGYALDALDEDDMMMVAEHLARCETCQAELRAYQAVADQLALAAAQAQPGPQVKEGLMKRVQEGAKPAAKPAPAGRRGWLGRFNWPAFAGALIMGVVLLATGAWLWQSTHPAQPALRVINFASTEYAPGATGVLVMSDSGEYGTLVVDHLPDLPVNQQYQLWLIQDGKRTSGGVFSVSDGGYASLGIAAPQPLIQYSSFGITVEPQGGSPGPTGKKVLGGTMTYRQ